jgi:hypothetical protein
MDAAPIQRQTPARRRRHTRVHPFMNDRDYIQLFAYFIGARGNHAVHVRSLIHAGFVVEPDATTSRKSYVINPASNEILGVILGEPNAVIGRHVPDAPEPPAEKPAEKVAGFKSTSAGW